MRAAERHSNTKHNYRHMKECKHCSPKNKPTKISNFTLIDGLYQRVQCKKCMKGQPNSYRHKGKLQGKES